MQIPTITISSESTIVIERMLPRPGEILVQPGQVVRPMDVIARAKSSQYRIVEVARQLAQPDIELSQVMLKREGDMVEANEIIARIKRRRPFPSRVAYTPVAGRLIMMGPGWVLLETARAIVELRAFAQGLVSKIIPSQGVIIKTRGTAVEAACGFGGEAYGSLKRVVDSPAVIFNPAAIDSTLKHAILLGGRSVDEATLRQLEAAEVDGIIVGSIDASLLSLSPPPKVCLVATEGFGDISMSPYTFNILERLEDRDVLIRAALPAPFSPANNLLKQSSSMIAATSTEENHQPISAAVEQPEAPELKAGSRVRVTRGKFLGQIGLIEVLPPKPQMTEAGIVAPGAFIKLDNALHYIPWANLELVV